MAVNSARGHVDLGLVTGVFERRADRAAAVAVRLRVPTCCETGVVADARSVDIQRERLCRSLAGHELA
jgi:hypothetical protein